MKKIVLIALCVCMILSGYVVYANEQDYDVNEYFPMQENDVWSYIFTVKEDGAIMGTEHRESVAKGIRVVNGKTFYEYIPDQSQGLLVLLSVEDRGILMNELIFSDKRIVLEPALVFLPKQLVLGEKIESTSTATTYDEKGTLIEKGVAIRNILVAQKYQWHRFKKTIPVSTMMRFNLKSLNIERKELMLLAKDIGIIKLEQTDLVYDKENRAPKLRETFRILKSALISGNEVRLGIPKKYIVIFVVFAGCGFFLISIIFFKDKKTRSDQS